MKGFLLSTIGGLSAVLIAAAFFPTAPGWAMFLIYIAGGNTSLLMTILNEGGKKQ